MDHISLSRWADLILIEPATANTISKLAKVHQKIWPQQLFWPQISLYFSPSYEC